MAKKNTEEKNTTISVKVMRDFWDDEGTRIKRGKVMELEAIDAIDGIESGNLQKFLAKE